MRRQTGVRITTALVALGLGVASLAPAQADETVAPTPEPSISASAEPVASEESPAPVETPRAVETPAEAVSPTPQAVTALPEASPSEQVGESESVLTEPPLTIDRALEVSDLDAVPEVATADVAAVSAALPVVTAYSAGFKPVGQTTYTWGSAAGLPGATVWTEVQVRGSWSRSQVGVTNASGGFTLPLTYGANTPGVYTWRVGVATPDGGRSYSESFTLTRHQDITAYSAGAKLTGATTYTWGTAVGASNARVFTEVRIGDRWSVSQIGTTSASGSYSLPLTYGANTPGTYTFRVGVEYAAGEVGYSAPFALQRIVLSVTAPGHIDPIADATISGTTLPSSPVRLMVKGTSWTEVASTTSNAEGRFTLPFKHRSRYLGTYVYAVEVGVDGAWNRGAERSIVRARWSNPSITQTTSAEVASTYRAGCPTGPSNLRTLRINYINFDGVVKRGEIIVRADLAGRVANAFSEGIYTDFRFRQIVNPNAFGGDDPRMMAADNTSGFNCRKVVGNPYAMSPHAYGIAVDINPAENPYRDPNGKWWPNATYATYRPASVMGLMSSNTPVVKSMQANGFSWYSGWDWHHFQYGR